MSKLQLYAHRLRRRPERLPPAESPASDTAAARPPRRGLRLWAGAALLGLALLVFVVPAHLAAAAPIIKDVPTLTNVVVLIRASAGRLPALLATATLRLWVALATLEIIAFALDRWRGKDDPVKPIIARRIISRTGSR